MGSVSILPGVTTVFFVSTPGFYVNNVSGRFFYNNPVKLLFLPRVPGVHTVIDVLSNVYDPDHRSLFIFSKTQTTKKKQENNSRLDE